MKKEKITASKSEMLDALMENIPDSIYFKDLESRFIGVSKAGAERTNIDNPDEVLGKTDYDLFSKEHADKALSDEQNIIKTNVPLIEIEEKETYKDKEDKWVSTTKMPFYDEKRKIIGTFGISRDITERKKTEQALEESKKNAERYLDIAAEIIISLDKSGNITLINDSGCQLLGYKYDELIGKDWFKTCLMDEISDTVFGEFKKLIKGDIENFETYENPVKTKDGEIKIILWHNTLIKDSNKNITGSISSGLDITDRKKAEMELRRSEGSLKKAQQIAKIGSWEWTVATDTVHWSEELCHINRHDPKLPIPSFAEMPSFYTRESWQRLNEAVNKAVNNGESYGLELDLIRTDGTIINTIARGEVVYDIKGKIVGLNGTVQDITERKMAEEALQASEEKFAKAFRSNPGGISITSLDNGKLIEVNKGFTDIFGYSLEEAIGHTTLELGLWINQEDRTRFVSILKKDGFVRNKELVLHDKYGGIVIILISAELISLMGKPHMLASYYNITEHKMAEEALFESEQKYRALFESSNEGILIAEIKTHKFKYANPAICQMLGYTEKELTSMDISAIHPKEGLQRVLAAFQNQVLGNSPLVVGIPCLRKDGTIFYADINGVIITIGGQKYGAGFFRDITERKNKESEIIYLSYHDKLTGLYNRRFVEEEIIRLDTVRQLPLSFIMADLNGLKMVNDAFGHTEGDKLLMEVAKILKKVCRSDDILSRWGGDEFVTLLPKTSGTDAEEIVQRIKKECAKTSSQKIPLSLAIGVAAKTDKSQIVQLILIDAESNMYKNKLIEKESLGSSILSALEQALYEKSTETKEHTDRIRDLTIKLGRKAKLASNQLDELSLLATLHDIGKVAIPETILLKEGNLTEKEWEIIKRHPEIGFNIAQSSPQIAHIAQAILSCHENWDGSGYPQGLKGQSIPVTSRIILIADAYDVMTNKRAYKKAISKEDAIKELKRCTGTQFDPVLVEKFIEIISK